MSYFSIPHTGEPITLQQFVDKHKIILSATFSIINLFDFSENSVRLKSALQFDQKATPTIAEFLVNNGVEIRFPMDKIKTENYSVEGNLVINNTDFEAFFDERIKEIIADTNYKPIEDPTLSAQNSKTFRFANNFTVWVWCRGLNKILNLTPFVQTLSTNTDKQGGNFSVTLSPVTGRYTSDGVWELDQNDILQYAWGGSTNYTVRQSDKSFNSKENTYKDNDFFFHQVIKSNDVFFIKMESLESEKIKRTNEAKELTIDQLYVDKRYLVSGEATGQKQIFDMIGLVDVCTETRDAEVNSTVSVSGRDLMKIILEDGVYFFANDVTGVSGGTIQTTSTSDAFKRLASGDLNFFNAYLDRTLDFSFKFIFYILSSIKIVDDNLFEYYGTDRTTKFEMGGDEAVSKTELVAGIWQIIKVVIDKEIAQRKIVDKSVISDKGTLKSFIDGKLIQDPFAEFYGDTYGNQYFFIARKPPFDQKSFLSNSKLAIAINPEDVYTTELSYADENVYSWYRIIPKGNFLGGDENRALAEFPVIFLEQYAEIWGSRPLQVVSNYVDFPSKRGEKNAVSIKSMTDQIHQDLTYLIESHAYIPFSRSGTITIKGDRRIKIGMTVELKSTGEIFYVDGTSNSATVQMSGTERTTVLRVSRGLKKFFLQERNIGVGGKIYQNISYFNIVEIKRDSTGVPIKGKYKVNQERFDFFSTQKQQAF